MELVNPGLGFIFWTTVSFLLLVVLLRLAAWKPILKGINSRNQKIDDALNAAEIAREEMKQLKSDHEKLVIQAKAERDQILKEAREIRDQIIEESKSKATIEAEKIIDATKESIKLEKLEAIHDLKNQIAILSIEIAEKVLEKELDTNNEQEKLIQSFLEDVNLSN